MNFGLAVLLCASRLRRDAVAKAEMLDFECWILDWQMKNPELWVVAKTATGVMEGVRKFWILDGCWNSELSIAHSKFVGCGAADGAAVSNFTISRMLPESF